MDLPVVTDETLGQPTRAQIFSFLVERRAPATTDQIARHFDLHPNGVRRHLERLVEGGFVTRNRVRMGQGRPRDSWAISSQAHPGGRRPRAYSDLATWLARAIPDDEDRLDEVERVGHEIGREMADDAADDPISGFKQAITALGFQPEMESAEKGRFTCTLRNCPYRESALKRPDVVCTLHRGITTGLLSRLAPEAKLVRFEPHDPDRAGCRVEVETPAPK